MDIGIVLQTDPPAQRVIELAIRAEAAGASHVWTFDSCVLWEEPFVIYSRILACTNLLRVGPMVTNPLTRDWTVTASLFATLNEMYGNRTVCGIGRGDSAVRVKGGRPATLAHLSEAMEVIKNLAEGRPVNLGATMVQLPWATGSQLDIWVGAYGPRALELAGRQADGLILQIADPYIVEWAITRARQAASQAGRDPDKLSVCVAAPAYVGDNLAHQRDQVRWFGGMVGNHVADIVSRYGAAGGSADAGGVPEALTGYIKGRSGYDYRHHGKAGNPSAEFVPDEVIDRFCILGPPNVHRRRLEELSALGVDQFAIYLMHDAAEETLEAYRSEVIPALGRSRMPAVDWPGLRSAAVAAASRGYAPWSGLTVGAAGLSERGEVLAACNVENASYGLTLCAECGLVSALRTKGHSLLRAVSIVAGDGKVLSPCGRCRQLLMDNGGPELLVDRGGDDPPWRLSDLLPAAFDGDELLQRRS